MNATALRRLAVAALLVALVLPAAAQPTPTPPKTPDPPAPDLRASLLSLASQPTWTNGAPGSTEVSVRVDNVGRVTSGYRVEYLWVAPDGTATPLRGEAQSSVDVGEPLPSGGARLHHMTWTLIAGQAGFGRIVANVTPASATDKAPADNAAALDVFVPVRAIKLADLSSQGLQVPPQSTRFLRLRVDNEGNAPATVHGAVIKVDPPEPRLTLTLEPASLVVPTGGHANLTLYARFEPAGDLTPFASNLTLAVDPGYGVPPNTTTGPVRDAPAAGNGGVAFDLTRAQATTAHVTADATTREALRVRNLGSRADDYSFSAVVPAGWQVSFDPPHVALEPGAAADVGLMLRAAASDPPGTAALVKVTAASGAAALQQTIEVPARRAGPGVGVSAMRLPIVYEGDEPVLEVDLVNDGDAPAPASSLALRVVPQSLPEFSLPPVATPALVPGLLATVRAPLAGLPGGNSRVLATWIAPSGAAQPAPGVTDVLVREPVARLQAPQPLAGIPGETVAYQVMPHVFTITNLSPTDEVFDLAAVAERGSAAVVGGGSLTLAPGDSRGVSVLHTLPFPAGGATDNLTLKVGLAARSLSWKATVATQVVDGQAPVVAVEAPALVAVGGAAVLRVTASDDVAVANASLAIVAPDGSRTNVSLVPGDGAGAWTASWSPQALGVHTLEAAATDLAGNTSHARATLEALAVAPPSLALLGRVYLVRPGQNVSFVVQPDPAAAGPLQSAEATLEQANETRHLNATVREGRVTVAVAADEGPARLTLAVRDRLGSASNLTVELFVQGESEPAEPTVAPRASGAPVGALLALLLLALAGRRRI